MVVDFSDFLVIIPTYRRPEFLAEALRSALGQTGVSKRIVVVDDCPDGSAQRTVATIDPSIVYLKNPRPSGGWPSRVRNYGIDTSLAMGIRARFVHFLDDDDTVPEGHYERVKHAFAANEEAGVVFGSMKPFCELSEDPDRRKRQEKQLRQKRQEFALVARTAWIYHHIGTTLKLPRLQRWLYRSHAMFGGGLFLCSGAVIRHEHLRQLGGFDPSIRITEDYEFYARAILANGVHFLQRTSANYRVGSVDSLWNPLGLDAHIKMSHGAEAQKYLTARYLRLQSEFGAVRFKMRKMTFTCATWILESKAMVMLDRLGLATFGERRRASLPAMQSHRSAAVHSSASR
jgi:glycosyltransferase involved in cell wall biosynthesis